ncbi:kinase phosphorylation protein [Gregarina niphandrodes]|uniref:Kinase phosphorylation protein n=1 Tax=Gregarina niphandrodes TaxID=110365 RepID=A0A023B7K1_GRENI|nr:kinase phosphorylation protein [Gregarina niphandrodes]EZG67326.1 kinase phosphorylation protein [Gregarina niphandrodes]|eukprot:XP_011130268.1 kinase phosphorylation protein [Gregarina niphandrodes]
MDLVNNSGGADAPVRDHARGGREQFHWKDVASQPIKDRECYLGQSVMVGMQGKKGRFSRNEWWTRPENAAGTNPADGDELERIKAKERELRDHHL